MSIKVDFAKHFEVIKLKDVFDYVIGGDWGKDPNLILPDFGTALCIRGSEFKNWQLEKGKTASLRNIKLNNIRSRQLHEGDILIEISGGGPDQPVGRTVLIDNQVLSHKPEIPKICTNFLRLARPTKHISPNYIQYYLKFFYHSGEVVKYQGGSNNLRNLKFDDYTSIDFPLPPLAEQLRIVAKIEELFSDLDNGIETLKTAKEQLKVYRQAVLKYAFEGKLTNEVRKSSFNTIDREKLKAKIQESRSVYNQEQIAEWESALKIWNNSNVLTKKPSRPSKLAEHEAPSSDHELVKWEIPPEWLWTQIGDICFVTKLAGFEYTDYVKYDDSGDLPVLKAENAGPNGFKQTNFSKVKSISVQNLKRSILKGGELLIVFVGAGTGNVAAVPMEERYFLGPNLGMARPFLNINSKFFEYQLRSAVGKRMLTASLKAVAQPSLSMGSIRQTPIVITSLEEQEKIVQEIESRLSICDKIEESIEQGLQQAEALRQSILKKAFEGKLVQQDPNDEPAPVLLERIKSERAAAQPVKKQKRVKI